MLPAVRVEDASYTFLKLITTIGNAVTIRRFYHVFGVLRILLHAYIRKGTDQETYTGQAFIFSMSTSLTYKKGAYRYTPQEKCFPWVIIHTVLHVTFPCPVKQGSIRKPNQQKSMYTVYLIVLYEYRGLRSES